MRTFPALVLVVGCGRIGFGELADGGGSAVVDGQSPAIDVTSLVTISMGGLTKNPVTGRYVQTVTITLTSAPGLAAPISFVVDNLSSCCSVWDPAGTTSAVLPAGSPYLDLSGGLVPGQPSGVQIQFVDTSDTGPIDYSVRILAGSGDR